MSLRHVRAYRVLRVALVIAATVARYTVLRVRRRLRLFPPSPAAWDRAHRRTGEAIHRLATRLGGAFVKLGQVLGARADVFPAAFVAPLRRLHDRVPARPLSALREHVERELGRPLDAVFASVDDHAIAAASLAQVHRARLLSGEDVVLKIQYPEARRLFPTDLGSLRRAVRVVRWMNRRLDLRALAGELATFVGLELDFAREARSTEQVRAAFAGRTDVRVPRVHAGSDRVLVLEYLPGRPIADVDGLRADGVDLERLAERVAAIYATMIFEHGFFHGDPHPGNILVQPDGTIGLIDFGLAKELPPGFAVGVAAMMVRAVGGDAPGAIAAAEQIGFVVPPDRADRLITLVRTLLGERAGGGAALLEAFADTGLDRVPAHFTLIVRVFILLNGLSHTLAPGKRVIPAAVLRALAAPARRAATPQRVEMSAHLVRASEPTS